MRLFVECHHCGGKIYLNSPAKTRQELPYQFTLRCPQLKCPYNKMNEIYTSRDVSAEQGFSNEVGGAVVLGALGGLVAGPLGLFAGAVIGKNAGSDIDRADAEAVERFNASW